MYILGLGGSDHDVSSTLMKDNKVICAIEDERVTRKKYGFNSNLLLGHSRKYVLNSANIKLDDVDLVVVDDILAQTACYGVRNKNPQFVNHHLLHAASAFYPSSFHEAAILVVDGAGALVEYDGKKGLECISYGYGKGNKIEFFGKVIGEKYHEASVGYNEPYQKGDPDNSLGYFYRLISHYCGFDFIDKSGFYFTEDGKTMGLAPYGTDRYYATIRSFVRLLENGKIEIDLRSGKFETVLNRIMADANFEDFSKKADLAWAGQKILEEALVHAANYLYNVTKCPCLCIAGGVGLNSVANGVILKETPFEEIFVQPASGDSGTSLGAAMWGYYDILNNYRNPEQGLVVKNTYLGHLYSDEEIKETLSQYVDVVIDEPDELAKDTANLIAEGNIVSLFHGRSEFGPRALGHRSILANPILPNMKDVLNMRVKFREEFRPFAPAVMYEHQEEYFDIKQYTPFMLIVADVRPEKRDVIPAVTHVDGTARLQSVSKESGGFFYSIIKEFYNLTNVPVILNTSFNVKGEPIVETPHDAIRCFMNTNIDYLVIGKYIVSKV